MVALPDSASKTSTDYSDADDEVYAVCVLTCIFLVAELIVLFVGITLFYDKTNILCKQIIFNMSILLNFFY